MSRVAGLHGLSSLGWATRWIERHIPDPALRDALLCVLALVLLAGVLASLFRDVWQLVELVLVVCFFFYLGLWAITLSKAVFPVGEQGTPEKVAAAAQARKTAARGLLTLGVLTLLVVAPIYESVTQLWPTVLFDVDYWRWKSGILPLDQFFTDVSVGNASTSDKGLPVYLDPSLVPIDVHTGEVTDGRNLLRLVASNSAVRVPGIRLGNRPGVAVIAGQEVIFDENSSVNIGNRHLLVLAYELVIDGSASDASDIYAYGPKDHGPRSDGLSLNQTHPKNPQDPSAPWTVRGKQGSDAGDVTIVVLGKVTKIKGSLSVDLRGEPGGRGPDGAQGTSVEASTTMSQTELATKRADDPSAALTLPGGIPWGFRQLKGSFLASTIEDVRKELAGAQGHRYDLRDVVYQELKMDLNRLMECEGTKAVCLIPICDVTDRELDGTPGQRGGQGYTGAPGGPPGNPGTLEVYYAPGAPGAKKNLSMDLVWSNHEPITNIPPIQETQALGGTGGAGGVGGPGGQPHEPRSWEDPLQVCGPIAVPGRWGGLGPGGPNGPRGPKQNHPGIGVRPKSLLHFR